MKSMRLMTSLSGGANARVNPRRANGLQFTPKEG